MAWTYNPLDTPAQLPAKGMQDCNPLKELMLAGQERIDWLLGWAGDAFELMDWWTDSWVDINHASQEELRRVQDIILEIVPNYIASSKYSDDYTGLEFTDTEHTDKSFINYTVGDDADTDIFKILSLGRDAGTSDVWTRITGDGSVVDYGGIELGDIVGPYIDPGDGLWKMPPFWGEMYEVLINLKHTIVHFLRAEGTEHTFLEKKRKDSSITEDDYPDTAMEKAETSWDSKSWTTSSQAEQIRGEFWLKKIPTYQPYQAQIRRRRHQLRIGNCPTHFACELEVYYRNDMIEDAPGGSYDIVWDDEGLGYDSDFTGEDRLEHVYNIASAITTTRDGPLIGDDADYPPRWDHDTHGLPTNNTTSNMWWLWGAFTGTHDHGMVVARPTFVYP